MTTPPAASPEPAPAPAPRDSIGRGVLFTILWQIGAIALSAPLLFTCWGLIQWIALIPLFIHWKRRGYPLAAKGVLIMGFVGVLVNATCAALILTNLNIH